MNLQARVLPVVILSLCVVSRAEAGPGDTLWTNAYSGLGYAEANCIRQTSDGGFVIAGSGSYGLVKIDASGDTVWTSSTGGHCVQQTTDGGYIMVYGDYLIKKDSLGNTVWQERHSILFDSGLVWVEQTSDGGYVAAGYAISQEGGPEPVYFTMMYWVKTDSLGQEVWSWTRGGIGERYQDARCIRQTNDGGYILVGTIDESPGGSSLHLVKTNSSGWVIWERSYGDIELGDGGWEVEQTDDGGYVAAGIHGSSYTDFDFLLVKTDSAGNAAWLQTYGGPGDEEARSVQQTADGGYILAGYTDSFGAGDDDMYVVRTASDGCMLWSRVYGGADEEQARSARQTADGGYVVAGYSTSFGAGGRNFYVVRLEGGEESAPPGSNECNPLVVSGGADQTFSIPFWAWCPGPLWRFGVCLCYFCPPYVGGFAYDLDSQSIADGVTFAGCVIPTGFCGSGIHTDAGDYLVDQPAGYPIEFSPGVTHFIVFDIPLQLDLETFEGDEFPLGIWVNNPDSVDVTFRFQALSDVTDAEEEDAELPEFGVTAPMPNPATRMISFSITTEETGPLDVRVVDVTGRIVRTIHDGTIGPGLREFEWDIRGNDGLQVAPGVYFVVVEGIVQSARKTVVIR